MVSIKRELAELPGTPSGNSKSPTIGPEEVLEGVSLRSGTRSGLRGIVMQSMS